jgi:LPXTG-site transpeptidase (sortase) family protein
MLSVGKIKVNTHVVATGLDDSGGQIVPHNPTEVSWFDEGAVPGQPGNAVFAGHTWSHGDGVFDRLSELSVGDVVSVRGNGCELTFQVATVQRHVPVNLSSNQVEELYSTDGPSGLVLFTCGDYSNGEYHSRIVVEASLTE